MKYEFIKEIMKKEYINRGIRAEQLEDIFNSPVVLDSNEQESCRNELNTLREEMSSIISVVSIIEVQLERWRK